MTKNPNITHPDEPLASAIRYVAHAISADPQERAHLRAVRLDTTDGLTEIVASDGHRLAYAPVRDVPGFSRGEIIIPSTPKAAGKLKAPKVREFIKGDTALPQMQWRVVSSTRPTYIGRVKRADLVSAIDACVAANARIAELDAPAHEITRCGLELSRWEAQRALARAAVSPVGDDTHDRLTKALARAKGDLSDHMAVKPKAPESVRVRFWNHGIWIATDEHIARIDGTEHKIERVASVVPHTDPTGEGVRDEIGLNARFLSESIQATEGEWLTIEAEDKFSPIRVRDGERWELIMPMRL